MEKQHYTQARENIQGEESLHSKEELLSQSMNLDERSEVHRSPFRLFVITIGAIFMAEVVAMGAVYYIDPHSYYLTTLVDAGIMTILIFPVLYYFSFRPLIRQMEKSWQAEMSLLHARELQDKFFDSINTLIAYMDGDFNFIRVNDAYARANGHTPDYFVGKKYFVLFPSPEIQRIFRTVLVSGQPFIASDHPLKFGQNPEPRERYWDWSLQPVMGSNGVVEGLVLSLVDVTERSHAQNVIGQLSRIVEQTEDTVVVTNCDGVIEYVNPAFEQLTGYSREEMLAKSPRLLKSGLQDDSFYREMWHTILGGDVFQREIANRKKNGEIFYEVKTITPLRDARGKITHFVGTGKDITEHKRDEKRLQKAYAELEMRVQDRTEELRIANSELEDEINIRRRTEEALRLSEFRLNRAQEIAHLGSWELNLIDNQLTWSDEVYRIFGLRPQEFRASYQAFLERVHPEDRAAVDSAYSTSVTGGKNGYEIEHRIVRRSDGEIRIVHEKCEHFRDETGQIIRSVGMVHDITERNQAEKRLAYLASFPQRNPNPVIEVDFEGRVLYANPAALNIMPDIEERELAHPWLVGLDRVIRAFQEGHTSITSRDVGLGERVYQQSLYFIAPDNLIRIYATDITERKQAEEELRIARNELELRVRERTQELADANHELINEISERKEIERQLRLQATAMESAANGIVITDPHGNIQWINPALAQMSGYDAPELIGQSTGVFKSGQHNADYYRQMWSTIYLGQVWRGEITNRRKDGTLYTEDQTITPVRGDQGMITHFIAIKQDITERKKAEAELERQNVELQILSRAEHQQRQFSEALQSAALILNKSLKLDEVLSLILQQVKGVIPYQLADIALLDGESFYDAFHEGEMPWPAGLMGVNNRFFIEKYPLVNRMCQSGEPVLVEDTQTEADWLPIDGLPWIRSVLAAPLLVEKRVIGFVNLFSDQPRFFTDEMSTRLVAFAAHAAAAIQNAWLFEQVQASTERLQSLSHRLVEIQETERHYISRELHDEAGQVLTSLLVDLKMLEKNASESSIILKIVADMENSLNRVIENLHRIAMALRPASLDHVGLVAALRQHVESIGEKHDLQASFSVGKMVERLPTNTETVIYRVVQEALTNIVRHSHATRVDVILTVRDDKLIVIVEDDGIGFDPDDVTHDGHLGLFGMRERADMINGKLMVESAPGKGTTIMLEVSYADTAIGRR